MSVLRCIECGLPLTDEEVLGDAYDLCAICRTQEQSDIEDAFAEGWWDDAEDRKDRAALSVSCAHCVHGTPVAFYVREDGTQRPIYTWAMALAASARPELRDRVLIDFDAFMQAGAGFAA